MSALKRIMIIIIALVISIVCECSGFASSSDTLFDTSAPGSGIKDTDGYITIKGVLNLDKGIPVTVMVAPRILDTDGETDITADRINAAESIDDFLNVVEYLYTFTLSENGLVDLAFYVKDSMASGVANVYVSYNGGEDISYIGFFEHVGKNDVNTLVGKFNIVSDADSAKSKYPAIISEDTGGLEVLRKMGAKTDLYDALTGKEVFSRLLYDMKPEAGFAPEELIDSFNESVAWMQLREEKDSLAVLEEYNTVYWTLELGNESDFASLSKTERQNVLSALKNARLSERSTAESAFTENIAIAKFRTVTDRNALEELLGNEKYAVIFEEVNKTISNSNLNKYEIICAYNYILERNSTITAVENMKSLFAYAVLNVSGRGGNNGSRGSGGGGAASGPILKLPVAEGTAEVSDGKAEKAEHPFKDVSEDHWASEYITNMYKQGIISGKTADSFAPEEKINRQDFVKMIVSAMKMEIDSDESTFGDVEKGGLYEPFIMTAVKNGIIYGISENDFGMSMNIRREDAAMILNRVAKNNIQHVFNYENTFADSAEIASYAQDAVKFCVECGLFKGDTENCFNPKNGLSRAEAVAVISRLLEVSI